MGYEGTPKKDGKGSYRSPYWYYPAMEGTNMKHPNHLLVKHHTILERFTTTEQRKSQASCFYKNEFELIKKPQTIFEKDYFGRTIILRQDVVIIKGKIETFTFIPLFYKRTKLVLQCVERPDCRTFAKAANLIVITAQIKDNEERERENWTYHPSKNQYLPKFKHTIDNERELPKQRDPMVGYSPNYKGYYEHSPIKHKLPDLVMIGIESVSKENTSSE